MILSSSNRVAGRFGINGLLSKECPNGRLTEEAGHSMLNTASLRTWFVLRAVRGLGDATICRLVQAFGSPEAVLAASSVELKNLGGLSSSLAQAVQRGLDPETQQDIDRELKTLERL